MAANRCRTVQRRVHFTAVPLVRVRVGDGAERTPEVRAAGVCHEHLALKVRDSGTQGFGHEAICVRFRCRHIERVLQHGFEGSPLTGLAPSSFCSSRTLSDHDRGTQGNRRERGVDDEHGDSPPPELHIVAVQISRADLTQLVSCGRRRVPDSREGRTFRGNRRGDNGRRLPSDERTERDRRFLEGRVVGAKPARGGSQALTVQRVRAGGHLRPDGGDELRRRRNTRRIQLRRRTRKRGKQRLREELPRRELAAQLHDLLNRKVVTGDLATGVLAGKQRRNANERTHREREGNHDTEADDSTTGPQPHRRDTKVKAGTHLTPSTPQPGNPDLTDREHADHHRTRTHTRKPRIDQIPSPCRYTKVTTVPIRRSPPHRMPGRGSFCHPVRCTERAAASAATARAIWEGVLVGSDPRRGPRDRQIWRRVSRTIDGDECAGTSSRTPAIIPARIAPSTEAATRSWGGGAPLRRLRCRLRLPGSTEAMMPDASATQGVAFHADGVCRVLRARRVSLPGCLRPGSTDREEGLGADDEHGRAGSGCVVGDLFDGYVVDRGRRHVCRRVGRGSGCAVRCERHASDVGFVGDLHMDDGGV